MLCVILRPKAEGSRCLGILPQTGPRMGRSVKRPFRVAQNDSGTGSFANFAASSAKGRPPAQRADRLGEICLLCGGQ